MKILVGIEPWSSVCKAHALTQHQYYPITTSLYFKCYIIEILTCMASKTVIHLLDFNTYH